MEEDSLKKGKQSPRGRSWLRQELCCQQLLIRSCWICPGGLPHNNARSQEGWQLWREKPAPSQREEDGTSRKVPSSQLPLGRNSFGFWAQAAEDAVFRGWWQILEKGQKMGQETGTYANEVWGWLVEEAALAI